MGFTNNYKTASFDGFEAKPVGDYEVILQEFKEYTYTTRDGIDSRRMSIKMLIRNDVDQCGKNGFLFHTLFRRKYPNTLDKQVEGYSFDQIMFLVKNAGLPEGKNYESLEALLTDLTGKCVRVTMQHQGEYKGKPNEVITNIMPTMHPECKHVFKTEQSAANDSFVAATHSTASEFIDDDLPFV